MKKSTKLIALLLALLFVVSALAGCNKKEEETGPKFTYVPEYHDMPVEAKDGYFNSTVYSNGRIYTILRYTEATAGTDADGNPTEESSDVSKLYSFLPDGTDLKEYPDLKVAPGTYDEATGESTYENINRIIPAGDKIYVMKNSGSYRDDSETGNYSSTDKATLCELDATGNIVNEKVLSENVYDSSKPDSSSSSENINSVLCSKDGSKWYLVGNDFIRVCDADFNELFSVDVQEVYSPFLLNDGSFAYTTYGDTGMGYKILDESKKAFGEIVKLPANWWDVQAGNADYPVVSANEAGIYGLDANGESTELVNYIHIDLDPSNIIGTYLLDDGNILCINRTYPETGVKTELILLKKTDSAIVTDKKILHMAVMYIDYTVRSRVIEFNKNNPEYKIEVTDYSQYITDTDYSAGLTKLNTEITSGNVPDIFYYQSLPMTKYASKGLFEDLVPYLEKDFGKGAMYEPLYNALLSDDGKLYELYSTFSVQTYYGLEKIVGDGSSWTYKDMKDAYAKLQAGATIFEEYYARADAVSTFLNANMDSYVDWKTGECHFDSEDFIGLLETSELFPKEFDWNNYQGSSESSLDRLLAGKQLLAQCYMYDLNSIRGQTWYQTKEPISFVGLPTNDNTGNAFNLSGEGYAISATSQYKDAAWDFIKEIFTEEYWNNNGWGIPANKKLFDAALETAMTPNYPDEETTDETKTNVALGGAVVYGNGYSYALGDEELTIINDKYGPSKSADGKTELPQDYVWLNNGRIPVYAMTEEERDTILEILGKITKISRYDNSLQTIINEECEAFYSGQKSAADTAQMIQSRVKLYVNEQK